MAWLSFSAAADSIPQIQRHPHLSKRRHPTWKDSLDAEPSCAVLNLNLTRTKANEPC
jgi:hypothetical protein